MLVDATAVPTDRGFVGRYVGKLLRGLATEGTDLLVVCRAHDVEHYRRLMPGVEPLAAAAASPHPGLGEGCGLPVVEATDCGAPVLTTGRLSLSGVGGDGLAGTDAGAAAITAVLLADLDRRAELATAGRERAAGLDWRPCARAHQDSYAAAAAG